MTFFESQSRRHAAGSSRWRRFQFKRTKPPAILLFFFCFFLTAHSQTPAKPAAPITSGLDRFITDQLEKWKVPGLAIAIVQNGQVVYSHGFGLRDVKHGLPVTTKTIFPIGSISKSFTSLSMGILNDEGKLEWDSPVRHYLPEFEMNDPVASERMTPRDLISHRVGLAGHDLVWYSSDFSREDLVHRLRFLQSDHDFRSGYHYSNMLVMTAGYLVGRIAGQSWEEFVRQRIFGPLQMSSSNFSDAESERSSDFSRPYHIDGHSGIVSEIPFHPIDNIGPAGSINSNIEDMARYVIFQLGKGKVGDRQLVSEANLKLNHTAQVPMPDPSRPDEIGPRSYAMGWVISSYRGHPLWWHNGGIDGFYALLALLPDQNFGVVMLTNVLGHHSIPEIVSYHLYDQVLGLQPVDWTRRFQDIQEKEKAAEQEEEKKELDEHKANTHPSHELKEYAGRYENLGYGLFTVELEGDSFRASLNKLTFSLQHYEYDVFESPPGTTSTVDIGKVRFLTDMDGEINAIAAPLEPDAPDILFTRVHEHEEDSPQQKQK